MNGLSRRNFIVSAGLALAHSQISGSFGRGLPKHRAAPLSRPFRPLVAGDPFHAPVGGPASPPTLLSRASNLASRGLAAFSVASASAQTPGTRTLVLYDTTNTFGWLGELYGIMAANLASHFGTWTAQPVVNYTAGQMSQYSAVIYIGSTYDEPLPVAFLDDVLAGTTPVVWVYDNIWQLTNRWAALNPGGDFAATYGWMWSGFDFSTVAEVIYKDTSLRRYSANGAGIMNYSVANPAVVLAQAVRADGSRFPWAVRSGTLTYFGENPFVYMVEGDRSVAFEDLLFDALAPTTVERHRALVRIEDINATTDPTALSAIGDYLASRGVPFSFGVIPRYRDLLAVENPTATDIHLNQVPQLVASLQHLLAIGGVMIEHGWTHQLSSVRNPYNGVTGDDFEWYRVKENADHTLNYVGPIAGDSRALAIQHVANAASEFQGAGLPVPTIFEFPHYAGSAVDYKAIGEKFATRYERALYFSGLLSGGTIDSTRLVGQRFSYVVRDVYGTKVIPENLGSVEPEPFFIFPTRFPADILGDARRVRVIRDGFASFYFHPFVDISYLKDVVEGLLADGWTFVSPTTV